MILRYIYINSRETTISVRNAVNCLLTNVMVWVPAESYSKGQSALRTNLFVLAKKSVNT